MTTMTDLGTRVSQWLQDLDHVAWAEALVHTQLRETIQWLARQQLTGEIVWRQGKASTGQVVFDDTTVAFAEVLYDGRTLRAVQEDSLTRLRRVWEQSQQAPQFWTGDLQAPQTIRLVPAPLTDGNAVPQFPALPLAGREAFNVIAFLWSMPQLSDAGFAGMDVLEDIVVLRTAGDLCGQAGEYRDEAKSMCLIALAQLLLDGLLRL